MPREVSAADLADAQRAGELGAALAKRIGHVAVETLCCLVGLAVQLGVDVSEVVALLEAWRPIWERHAPRTQRRG